MKFFDKIIKFFKENYRIIIPLSLILVVFIAFMVYYKVEKLGLIKSVYYFINWAINGFFKYK